MKSLLALDPAAEFRFFGGELMQAVGGTLVKHYRNMAFMGFLPVLLNLRAIARNMKLCKDDLTTFHPDVVIMVDYPGFNLKIAKFVKRSLSKNYYQPRTVYYISPKIWAWKTYRIKGIKKYIDQMLCILPFEVDFYQKHAYPVEYVGNPTVDAIAHHDYYHENIQHFITANQLSDKPIIALLAGSRKQEIKDNLPAMLEAASTFKDYQSVIAGAPGIDPAFYNQFLFQHPTSIVLGQTYRLLQHAEAALVTSGTATLETALLETPQAVCYKVPVPKLSSWAWEHLFQVKYISLVNLIAGRTVVQELFGIHFSVPQIRQELQLLLHDSAYRATMQAGYQEVITKLGGIGASHKAAEAIIRYR
jgi:lipid-A-disaccharide synthase